jgi:superfamily I DNA/RNA helicase
LATVIQSPSSTCPDKEKEAESVVMKLQAHRFEHQGKFRDYAILYRGNFQARAIEQFLRNQRIPYLLSGGQSFFEKAEIKDITSYLRLLANNDDDPAFIRAVSTPRRGVGTGTLQALGSYAGERRISLFAAAFEQGFAATRPDTPTHPPARVLRVRQTPASARRQRTGSTGDGRSAHRDRLRALVVRRTKRGPLGSSGAMFRSSATG